MSTKNLTLLSIFLLANSINLFAQIGTNGGSGMCFGINHYRATSKGLYEKTVTLNPSTSFSTKTVTSPKDGGSNTKPEFMHIFSINDKFQGTGAINLPEFLNLLFFPDPSKTQVSQMYRLKNLSADFDKSNPAYDAFKAWHADVFNFKINARKNNFLYGFNWRCMIIGSPAAGGYTTLSKVEGNKKTDWDNTGNMPSAGKGLYGINIGYVAKLHDNLALVSTATIGRDPVIYRDNGRLPDGFLVNGDKFLINRNYNLESTLYFGKGNKGLYFSANYDILKGKVNAGRVPFEMTKLSLRFGIYLPAFK